jgi:sarcosine oxidase subunit gamma
MAERLSALSHLPAAAGGDFTLSQARYGSLLQVQAGQDTIETVKAVIISELLGDAVPPLGSASVSNDTIVAAVAPGRFWIAGGADLVRRLDTAFPAGDAAITDISHGRVVLRLQGAAAERLLQSCVMLDLDPASFPAGRIAQTMIHHIDVMIHRRGETEFEVWVLRSFAQSLAEWLADAGAGLAPRR